MGRQLPSTKRTIIDLTGSDDEDASQVYQPSQGANHRSQVSGRVQADENFEGQPWKKPKISSRPNQQAQSQRRTLPWENSQDSGYQSQSSQSFTQNIQNLDYDEDDADEMVMSPQDTGNYEMETFEKYGSMETKVVGIQYYDGIATSGEYVSLSREPNNEYDTNAIRVDNVQRKQIGHIPRQLAARLAKYIDRGSLVVEAVLAGDSRRSTFTVPMDLGLYGTSDPMGKERLKSEMKRDGLPTNIQDQREQMEERRKRAELEKAARDQAQLAHNSSQQWQTGINPGAGEQSFLPLGPSMEELIQDSQAFNPREVGEYSERFGTDEATLEKLPEADQPKRIVTRLLPYQRQGLAWLIEKENLQLPARGSKDIVQLWKRAQSNNFTNIATNYTQKEEPKLASGGILADDMGLGKTLQIISLILADTAKFKLKSSQDGAATLIVAPLSVMSNWRDQVIQHIDSKRPLNVFIYHGQNRPKINSAYMKDNQIDVMITTYGTLSTEYMPRKLKKGESPKPIPRPSGLFSIKWRRVVLDEGHTIRNPITKGALAATALMARSRWVLTGTPIINSLKDLYSILRFIGITGGLEKLEHFNSLLIRPMSKNRGSNDNAVVLLQALMASFCLRRKKEMAFIDLKLPELTEYIHRCKFTKAEEKRYLALQAEAQGMLRQYDRHREDEQGARARDAYHHLLEVLLRLRQVCNHWKLCRDRMASIIEALEREKTLELTPENRQALQRILQLSIESRDDCPICLDDLTGHEPVITHCGHIFGKSCALRVIESQAKCPMCRADLPEEEKLVEPAAEMGETVDDDGNDIDVDGDDKAEANDESSKVTALLEILQATHKKPNPKIVIFSQWSSFLTLLQPHLDKKGYKYARIDGSMSANARDVALHALSDDDDTTILLASLGCCAVGLNLIAANTVVMCDSWWAPAIEDQAVDRVHRLGQTRDCTVWRLVVEETIEQKVLDIQADKRKLMAAAFREKEGKRGRVRERMGDIRRLLE